MSNLYENEHYIVVRHDDCLGEDGRYGRDGYAVVHKEHAVVEHTTTLFPQALFQADAMSGALGQLSAEQADIEAIEGVDQDVTIQ